MNEEAIVSKTYEEYGSSLPEELEIEDFENLDDDVNSNTEEKDFD
jgi:hypothetical protein